MAASPFARISLTLPPEILAAADRLAREMDRSRSWVIATAIGAYAESIRAAAAPPPAGRDTDSRPLSIQTTDRILGFQQFQDYRQWCAREGTPVLPPAGQTLPPLSAYLDGEGARYMPVSELGATGAPLVIRIEPEVDNARRVLRGLHRAGFRFAREFLAETVVQQAVTVIGVAPRVDIVAGVVPGSRRGSAK